METNKELLQDKLQALFNRRTKLFEKIGQAQIQVKYYKKRIKQYIKEITDINDKLFNSANWEGNND